MCMKCLKMSVLWMAAALDTCTDRLSNGSFIQWRSEYRINPVYDQFSNGSLQTRQKMSILWFKMSGIWMAHLSHDQTIRKLDKIVSEKSNIWISGVQYSDGYCVSLVWLMQPTNIVLVKNNWINVTIWSQGQYTEILAWSWRSILLLFFQFKTEGWS